MSSATEDTEGTEGGNWRKSVPDPAPLSVFFSSSVFCVTSVANIFRC